MGRTRLWSVKQIIRCIGQYFSIAFLVSLSACGSPDPPGSADSDTPAVGLSQRLAGQAAYDALCASCHEAGIGEAPATGDAAAWSERSPLWIAVLAEHAKNGYLEMPVRGGDEGLSDADVEAATEYMLSLVYPDRLRDQ